MKEQRELVFYPEDPAIVVTKLTDKQVRILIERNAYADRKGEWENTELKRSECRFELKYRKRD